MILLSGQKSNIYNNSDISNPLGLSVIEFGAIPNDGIDDFNAFTKALIYCHKHKRNLLIPSGSYDLSRSLNVRKVSIIGEDTKNTILNITSDGKSAIAINDRFNEKRLEHFTLKVLNKGKDGICLYQGGNGAILNNLNIIGYDKNAATGVSVYGRDPINNRDNNNAYNIRIENCRTIYFKIGIAIYGGVGGAAANANLINNCVIKGPGKIGILIKEGQGNVISNTTINATQNHRKYIFFEKSGDRNTVIGCYFDKVGQGNSAIEMENPQKRRRPAAIVINCAGINSSNVKDLNNKKRAMYLYEATFDTWKSEFKKVYAIPNSKSNKEK